MAASERRTDVTLFKGPHLKTCRLMDAPCLWLPHTHACVRTADMHIWTTQILQTTPTNHIHMLHTYTTQGNTSVCVCVCVCACARACMHACVLCVCNCVCACVCKPVRPSVNYHSNHVTCPHMTALRQPHSTWHILKRASQLLNTTNIKYLIPTEIPVKLNHATHPTIALPEQTATRTQVSQSARPHCARLVRLSQTYWLSERARWDVTTHLKYIKRWQNVRHLEIPPGNTSHAKENWQPI